MAFTHNIWPYRRIYCVIYITLGLSIVLLFTSGYIFGRQTEAIHTNYIGVLRAKCTLWNCEYTLYTYCTHSFCSMEYKREIWAYKMWAAGDRNKNIWRSRRNKKGKLFGLIFFSSCYVIIRNLIYLLFYSAMMLISIESVMRWIRLKLLCFCFFLFVYLLIILFMWNRRAHGDK